MLHYATAPKKVAYVNNNNKKKNPKSYITYLDILKESNYFRSCILNRSYISSVAA